MVTITDVSLLANVSKATVSRVMSGSRGVKAESREAVLRAAEELNYRPSAAAQSLANQRTDYIGVILSSSDAGQVSTYLPLLSKSLKQRGKHMLVQFAETADEQTRLIEELMQSHCDAVITLGGNSSKIKDDKVIAIDGTSDSDLSIGYDYKFAAESACRFLASKGHTSIALVLDDDNVPSKHVLDGYKNCLQNLAIPVNRQLIVTANSNNEQSIMSLLNSYSPFTAIVVMRDSQAAVAMNLLRDFNLATPNEVSIMSLEDSQLASQLNPQLTCISCPSDQLVTLAMEQLDACLSGKSTDKKPLVTGKLVTRDSVANRS
ncbi:LacI family transcriptional regulator [Vibrio vulnificus]|uniref:LacI family DNA-binding transcriptional regulator n=1 Tax=Vibrio vulnificus TaxID=672 RepID=UPI000BA8603B|nr:LacI family DNA-binding transcriptional regulator [Vibrio vulnificus]PAO30005.1 LacI family transcriptional regulator [Vibrio vulnificus]PAO42419.1 LacI family transcriptional regulator [Vibrio vulnificus]PAO47208.1 LacI family transcriptional regulator [Vibrio vulnificus]PAO50868.1 LacI family transcriptional regulator [Vibrio vulnificus]PAO59136.1 LacI family transcriptional regulator [Vibrio vulnificus]